METRHLCGCVLASQSLSGPEPALKHNHRCGCLLASQSHALLSFLLAVAGARRPQRSQARQSQIKDERVCEHEQQGQGEAQEPDDAQAEHWASRTTQRQPPRAPGAHRGRQAGRRRKREAEKKGGTEEAGTERGERKRETDTGGKERERQTQRETGRR